MASEYSLNDVLPEMHLSQIALETALMELTLHVEVRALGRSEKMCEAHCRALVKMPAISNKA